MDLWVRTQDKQTLKKVTKIFIFEDIDIHLFIIKDQDKEILGVYDNQKRCEEILDEIDNSRAISKNAIFVMPSK